MEKEFVPYELAVKLKELGFDEHCLTKYGMTSKRFYDNYVCYKNSDDIYESTGVFCNDLVSAPLWQQAFEFFEEKHNLHSHIDNVVLSFGIIDCRNNDIKIAKYISSEDCYKTKLEVKQSCLEKLIQLIQNKNDRSI